MKTMNIRHKLLLLLLSVGLISCSDDFLDVNENPNDPANSTPSLTLPVAQHNFGELTGTTMNYLGNYMVYNYTVPSNWSANASLIRYQVTSNFYGSIFENSYGLIFRDLTYLENYEDESGAVDYGAYDVIAKTIKGFQYQYLVDLYGDVPFTEANLRGENPTPAYDEAEFVYKSVIDSLDMAINLAGNLPENAENPGSQDIIFGGNMGAWARFANTIKLRMLIRMSGTGQDQYIQEELAQILANGNGFISSDVTANPGYSNNADQQAPVYEYMGFQPSGTETDRWDFTAATDYAISFLENTNDPRIGRIYSASRNADEFKGAPQTTELPGSGFTSDDLSHPGPGIVKSADMDQPIMLLAEALFLQAEAVQRGWMEGDAQALYEAAIEASFDYLGAEGAEEYYSQNIENVGWEASSDKIEAIITQKWVALNGISGIESWIELTRTGYPDGLPIPAESGGTRPVRLMYPVSELARNSDNVPSQGAQDAFNNPPFWK